jgi:SAM-dependent methyltransferase
MYAQSAPYYDAIYGALGKDYGREAARIHALIQEHKRSAGNILLDVACGTGGHIGYLRRHYTVEGLDVEGAMLDIARRKHPDIVFHQGNMVDSDLGRQFDAIVCLFSAIAYTGTVARLGQAMRTMRAHLRPGGVVIVEPFIRPEVFRDGHLSADFVDQPELKLARVALSRRRDGLAVLEFHFLVGTPEGVQVFTEQHELALFTHTDFTDAFQSSGLETTHDPDGLIGRGLYIGTRPPGTGLEAVPLR